jgi:alanyl-tRNA synthetase
VEVVALIASIVSIALAFFAIWQANHHRDQSDKLNRDTTEKLARIEAFATSTKEDAFAEIRKWGDFARAGGKASEEVEKVKEEELRKLKDELQSTTSAEINKVLQTIEAKLSSSTQASTISEIKKEFEELKKEISKIQEKAVVETAEAEKRRRISTVLAKATPSDKAILRAMAQNQWTKLRDLVKSGYKVVMIIRAITLVDSLGLLAKQTYKPSDGELSIEYRLDEDLKEALLR